MKLNLGLNLDGIPATSKTGDYRYAENVILDNTFQFPTNEDGMLSCNIDLKDCCGIIPFDKGFIAFDYTLLDSVYQPCIQVINTNFKEYPFERVIKTIIIPQINFTVDQPVRGTTSYNQNGNLICIFSCGVNGDWEDKIIDIDSYFKNLTINTIVLTDKQYYKLDLNPNIQFPKVSSSIINGSLLTGSYQIAICYKLDKEYTNYSLLSLPNFVYSDSENYGNDNEGLEPNVLSTKGISYTFTDLDLNYEFYRVAIIYNDGTSFTVYNSKDISTVINSYDVKENGILDVGSLDDILTNSIFYSNSESINVMNNRLYRANVKGYNIIGFDAIAQNIANNVSINLVTELIDLSQVTNFKSKQYIKFQSDEVYALYLTLGDKKGNVIGSYPINTNTLSGGIEKIGNFDNTNKVVLTSTLNNITAKLNHIVSVPTNITLIQYYEVDGNILGNEIRNIIIPIGSDSATINTYTPYTTKSITWIQVELQSIVPTKEPSSTLLDYVYHIPAENINKESNVNVEYTINTIEITLPNNINILLDKFKDIIGFWCIHRAQRNNSNSKIFTQGVGIAGSLQELLDASSELSNASQLWYCNPDATWSDDVFNTLSYFPHNTDFREKYPIRFYSFEDLFNHNNNFPLGIIESISQYNTGITHNNIKTLFNVIPKLYKTEIKYVNSNNIISQSLLEDNNLEEKNFYQESTRQLYLDSSSSNLFIATNNAPDLNKATYLHRCNIINPSTDYYKYIFSETLVLCSTINLLKDNKIIAIGDTFYSDFYIRFKRLYPNLKDDIVNNKDYTPIFEQKYLYDPVFLKAIDNTFQFRVFIESKYNIHARYWKGDYPKYDNPIKTSEAIGYNKVFNLQNTENIVTPIDYINNIDRKINSNIFNTRIIKSTKSNLEANQLGFREYLALDYYDMPYNRGDIKAVHSTYKNMYIQQELGLAIASIKDVLSYQEGTTYTGSGELFDRQPVEVIPTEFGFVGCEDYFNCGMTDVGFWTIDNVQGMVSLVTDNNVKLISEGKNKYWLRKHLKGNNPFKGEGCFINYDNIHKRLLLTIGQDYTLSYIPEIQNWLSFHYYKPYYGIYTRNRTLHLFNRQIKDILDNDINVLRLFKYDSNYKGQYSDSSKNINDSLPKGISPMIISIYMNDEPEKNKIFESLYWDTKFIINDFDIYNKTFDKLFIHNDTQCTGIKDINIEGEYFDSTSGVYKEELWIFNQLFDYVKDNKTPFLYDFINFLDNFDYNKDWFNISKIMSIFACVTFFFDNSYYTSNGQIKSLDVTRNDLIKPNILLKDMYIQYKHDNR